jgi:hypothetical protein
LAYVDSEFLVKINLQLNQSQPSLTWAWHSSAPACLIFLSDMLAVQTYFHESS